MSTDQSISKSNPQTDGPGEMPTQNGAADTFADEQQLVLQVREGSREAFRRLVERHMRQTYNLAYSFVRNHHDAEEIAQEVFVRAHRSIASFRGDSEIATWLHRITVNLSLSRLKRNRKNLERMVRTHTEIAAAPDDNHQDDIREHIERALHELPTLQRAVVILRHMQGLSTRQVSSILKCSEGTVKTHLYRGLRKLRSRLSYLKAELA